MIKTILISFLSVISFSVFSHRLSPVVLETDNKIQESLTSVFDSKFSKQKIFISSYNYRVLLYGDVQNLDIKNEVELISKQNSSVRSVINLLNIVSEIPVPNPIIDKNIIESINKQLSSNVVFYSLKVSVFNGNVYLQGVVTKSEGDSISQQISQIPNVKSVIRVFDFLKEEDMKKIDLFGIK